MLLAVCLPPPMIIVADLQPEVQRLINSLVSPQYNLIPTVHSWTIGYTYMAGSISTQIKILPWPIRFIDIIVQFLVHAKTAALAPHAYMKRSHIISCVKLTTLQKNHISLG